MKIEVLGTTYTVFQKARNDDKFLASCDGYCDKTSKKIVIVTQDEDCELDDFEVYRRKLLRHEIVHAFFLESGLHENFWADQYSHEEMIVDWIAVQSPKIIEAFKDADAL